MATATRNKTVRTLQASTSVAAGGTQNSTSVNLLTADGGFLTVRLTNGGTGPTLPCAANVQVSRDDADWHLFRSLVGQVANSGVYEWGIEIPSGVAYLRVVFTGHTGQAVTVQSYLVENTSWTIA